MSTLTSLLARDAIVSVDAIEEALQRQVLDGGEIDTALLELGAADENVLASYRAASFECEPVTRARLMSPDPEALAMLSQETAQRLGVVPVGREDGRLILCAAEPLPPDELQALGAELEHELELCVGTEVRVAAALAKHYALEPPSRLRILAEQLDSRAAGELREVAPPSDVPQPDDEASAAPPAPGGLELPPTPAVPGASEQDALALVQVAPVVALGAGTDDGVDSARSQQPEPDEDDTRPARPGNRPPSRRASTPVRSSPRPPPRHSQAPRGPLTRDATIELLGEAATRDQVLDLLFAFARQYFECTALFSLREGHLIGLEASGLRSALDARAIDVAFSRDGTVNDVVLSHRPRVINLATRKDDRTLVDALGRRDMQPAALVPVAIRKRIVALLYGDRDGQGFELVELADLIETLPEVTRAFERIIQEHKVLVMQARHSRAPARPSVPEGSFAASRPPAQSAASAPPSALPSGEQGDREASGPNPGSRPSQVDTSTGPSPSESQVPGSPEGPRRRAPRLPHVDEPFRRSQIGERLAQNALSSLGVRGAAPAPPDGGEGTRASAGDPSEADEEFENRPTVTMAATHVLQSAPPKAAPSPGAYHQSSRPGPRDERDITRSERPRKGPPAQSAEAANHPDSKPPPRTLSQSSPGMGSYNVNRVHSEHVELPGEAKKRRASRPAQARAPGERQRPRNTERPPGPPPTEEEQVGSGAVPAARTVEQVDPDHDANHIKPSRDGPRRKDPRRDDEDPSPSAERVSIPEKVSESLLPPSPPVDDGPQEIVLDFGSEAQRVVEELARCAPDEEGHHVAALLRLGDAALEALTQRFPGGLWFNRNLAHQRLPAGRDVSAVARALYAFEDRAAPYIARLLQSSRGDVRLYAILLAVERVLPELLWPLYERIFDSDGGVRRLMYEHLPLYRNVESFGEVLDALRTRAADDSEQLPNRLAALEAVSVLRDPGSVELLWELSNHDSRQLSVPATRALTALTGQDFGGSARKWRNWFNKNKDRHRAEWLIDSLMHSDERVREIAGNELQKLSQVYYGYAATASKRERDKAKKRYEAWWQITGKTQFT